MITGLVLIGSPAAEIAMLHHLASTLFRARPMGSDHLLGIALIAVALALAIAVTATITAFAARRRARFLMRLARRRARHLANAIRTLRLAEDMAHLGVWQYDPHSGTQQWSKGLRLLFGIDQSDAFVDGDAETLLFANNIDFVGAVKRHRHLNEPYELMFDLDGFDETQRSLCVHARNIREPNGEIEQVIAIVRDVTHQRELESSRAIAVEQASKAIELAQTDPLTGLANRRRLMAQLDVMIAESRKSDARLSLIIFDIDHFKQVNDTHGHLEGDAVLKRIARIAEAQCRAGDVVGRLGGEEFVWIVPGVSETMAKILSERLRQAVARDSATAAVLPVTISLGVASMRPADSSLSLFARADGALYDAKGAGRNRVRMAA